MAEPGRTSLEPQMLRAGLGQASSENQRAGAGPGLIRDETQIRNAGPGLHAPDAHYRCVGPGAALLVWADAVDDLERIRIATSNRIDALERDKGLGASIDVGRLRRLRDALEALEHDATLGLRAAMRAHPLGAWVRQTIGVGEKQAARLLAAIGDPALRSNPAKLWAYCGLHVIDGAAPRRRRGERANWSTQAKTRAWLVALSTIKHRRSPYRAVYDRERAKWAERETSDGHKHAHALRVVAKAILRDLWIASRPGLACDVAIPVEGSPGPARAIPIPAACAPGPASAGSLPMQRPPGPAELLEEAAH